MRAREQRRDGERSFARGRVVRLRWASVAKEYRFMARPTRYGAQGRSARSARVQMLRWRALFFIPKIDPIIKFLKR